jgi:hypothetical protein
MKAWITACELSLMIFIVKNRIFTELPGEYGLYFGNVAPLFSRKNNATRNRFDRAFIPAFLDPGVRPERPACEKNPMCVAFRQTVRKLLGNSSVRCETVLP